MPGSYKRITACQQRHTSTAILSSSPSSSTVHPDRCLRKQKPSLTHTSVRASHANLLQKRPPCSTTTTHRFERLESSLCVYRLRLRLHRDCLTLHLFAVGPIPIHKSSRQEGGVSIELLYLGGAHTLVIVHLGAHLRKAIPPRRIIKTPNKTNTAAFYPVPYPPLSHPPSALCHLSPSKPAPSV